MEHILLFLSQALLFWLFLKGNFMHFFNLSLYKNFGLVLLCLFFVSCGSMNLFRSTETNKTADNANSVKISALESKVMELKQEQADAKFLMERKDLTLLELEDTIKTLKSKIAILEEAAQKPVITTHRKSASLDKQSSQLLYTKARNVLIEGDYKKAADLFSEFIKKYPNDSLADNAVYWLGECYYSLADYKQAISIFKSLDIQYPKSEKIPDALLKTGYSYLSMDDTNRAHHYLTQVLKKYPFSSAAEKAQEKLRSFK